MTPVLQTINQWDIGVFHFLNGFAGNGILDRLVSYEESINLIKGGLFLAIYWFFWFDTDPDQRDRRQTIITILSGALIALVVARTIANVAPFRTRPMFDPSLSLRPYAFTMPQNLESWSAFPSDTATYFAALAYGLGHLSRRLALPIGLYTAVWICIPRMYLGIHYASDVFVGAAIGIAVVWASVRTEGLRTLAERLLAWVEEKPRLFYASAFLVSFEMAELFDTIRNTMRGLLRVVRSGPYLEPLRAAAVMTILGLVLIACLAHFFYRSRQYQTSALRRYRLRFTKRW